MTLSYLCWIYIIDNQAAEIAFPDGMLRVRRFAPRNDN
jgi:hypothetical protein